MKRMIAWLLLVTMLLGAFAGCGSNTEQAPTQAVEAPAGDIEGITAAIDYLKMFYKDGGSKTGADFERYGIVRIAGVPYEVVWTADVGEDLIKAVVNDDGSVTIDVSEDCAEDTPYVLTATITDDAGNAVSNSWEYILPAGMGSDYCAIVDMAYALEKGAAMETPATLVGTVTAINTAWSEEYKNITVTIVVKGREDKPIECYRLKGEGAKDLAVGDLITVTGIIKNYNGKIEFDAGSEVVAIAKGAGDLGDIPTDPIEILTSAYALEVGAALPYTATLTGEVTGIDTPYSPDYKNISVSIEVDGCEDMPILCYRMKGTGVETLMPGDVITVTGTIKNYNGTIEFDAGCQAVSITKGENSMEIPTDPNEILKAAVDLEHGQYLPYPVTLTGEIIGLGYGGYSEQYGNITVSLRVGDGYYVKCYRMKGVDIDKIWLGDEITVTGNLMDYDGTIEFDAGCQMISWVDKPNPKAPSDPAEIVKAAYKLSNFSSLPYYCTLTGEVIEVKHWSPDDGCRNLVMEVEGKKIEAYKLTGTGIEGIQVGDTITVWGMLKNYWGTIEFDSGCKLVSKQSKVVKDLFDLEPGETMEDEQVLTGTVTSVKVGSSSSDVKIKVKGETIYCPGVTGYGYDLLEKKDTVTVRGILENKDGTYQFQSGSEIQSWSNYNRPKVNAHTASSKEIAYAASQLGTADSLHNFAVTGKIIRVDEAYSKEYENITVTIKVGGIEIQCYRLKGKGADKIGVGDTISVDGDLVNYKGKIEFEQGCEIGKYVLTEKKPVKTPTTLKEQMEDAVKNGGNNYDTTVQGIIIDKPSYRSKYGNYTFTVKDNETGIEVYCYGLGGNDYTPKKGDEIKIVGKLGVYNSKAQFTYTAKLTVIKQAEDEAEAEKPATLAEQIADAVAKGGYTGYTSKIQGKIVTEPEYQSKHQNYTFTVRDEETGIEVYCYGLGGGSYKPSKGDVVKIEGELTAYNGKAQFDYTSTLTVISKNEGGNSGSEDTEDKIPETLEEQMADAVANGSNSYTSSIQGKIVTEPELREKYGNYTFTVKDDATGIEVYCYGLGGSGYTPSKGDVVKIVGKLGSYNGQAQFTYTSTLTVISQVGSGGSGEEEECTHENTTTTTVDATCTVAGSKTVVCDDCGETVSTTPIDKLDHTYVEGVCSCGAEDPDYVAPESGDDTTPEGGDDTTPEGGSDTIPEGGDDTTTEGGTDPVCDHEYGDDNICTKCGDDLTTTED